ncbi:MAG: hypothetical protein JWM85_1783 [Acidimicrobiaceae bacterium]|nr:hypothetical protein [Acidimicrobiaceae bacterium]
MRAFLGLLAGVLLAIGGGVGAEAAAGTGSGNPTAAVSSAIVRTAQQKSADFSVRFTVSLASGSSASVSGSGAADLATDRFRLSFNNLLGASSGPVELLMVGGKIYLGAPQLAQLLGGKTWIAIPEQSAPAGTKTSSNNASQTIKRALTRSGVSVRDLGGAAVGGVSVEHYVIRYGANAIRGALGKLPVSLPASSRQVLKGLGPVSVGVWIDGSGLVRQLAGGFFVPLTAGAPSRLQYTVGFSNFGTPVQVQAPPASEVAPFSRFAKTLGGAGAGTSALSGLSSIL